ncbi:hypothetical protein I3F58_07100 [Streptomyces sp. MUM 203J]|uniref:hypothetical protein n=1 Tax=Streptomyces sp. MUM 203J TaxID=2791990 RepID=UPI001F0355C7|nr:hypothetical protein [Streptomyces sp. MUM 203J]MCH0539331.1 hypothetical protein [Streptomyces sp. MUM 203J]
MITSTPVARWTWGRFGEAGDQVVGGLRGLLAAHVVLWGHGLVAGLALLSVTINEAGKSNDHLFVGEFEFDAASPASAEQFAERIRRELRPGEMGSVFADARSDGLVAGPGGILSERRLFRLGSSTVADYVGVDLVTFSDVWMPVRPERKPAA